MSASLILLAIATALCCTTLGGGFYEFSVVDPAWPRRPEIVQPARGGISRKRFWIPAHTAFELALIASLVLFWSVAEVRMWLLVALGGHLVMRLWSAVDFIPKALRFEAADPSSIDESTARRWTRRSPLRLPLDLITCFAMFSALVGAVRLT